VLTIVVAVFDLGMSFKKFMEICIQNCVGTLKMSYHRRLSMVTSSRHKPEIACVVKSTTLRHWRTEHKRFT